jgi:hypothetical protein
MFGGGSKKGKNRKGASLNGGSGRKSKKVNVHGDGNANKNRSGGKPRGARGAR